MLRLLILRLGFRGFPNGCHEPVSNPSFAVGAIAGDSTDDETCQFEVTKGNAGKFGEMGA